jgi:hypothetical protein
LSTLAVTVQRRTGEPIDRCGTSGVQIELEPASRTAPPPSCTFTLASASHLSVTILPSRITDQVGNLIREVG